MCKARLGRGAQEAQLMRAEVEADRLKDTQVYLARMFRKLPPAPSIQSLMDAAHDKWNLPDLEKGDPPTKGGKSRSQPEQDPRKELLRQIVLHLKGIQKISKHIVEHATPDP